MTNQQIIDHCRQLAQSAPDELVELIGELKPLFNRYSYLQARQTLESRGGRWGGARKIKDNQIDTMCKLRKAGWSTEKIASMMNISSSTVYNYTVGEYRLDQDL